MADIEMFAVLEAKSGSKSLRSFLENQMGEEFTRWHVGMKRECEWEKNPEFDLYA